MTEFETKALAALERIAAAMEGGAKAASGSASRSQRAGGNGGSNGDVPTTFPNYGRSKNAPIAGATMEDLEYYAAGARRSIADPGKAKWHDKERALLHAIQEEQARQSRGVSDGTNDGYDEDAHRTPTEDEIPF